MRRRWLSWYQPLTGASDLVRCSGLLQGDEEEDHPSDQNVGKIANSRNLVAR